MFYHSEIIYLKSIVFRCTPKLFWKFFIPDWLYDYETSLVLAQYTKKIVLAHFTSSDTSRYCQYLEKEVYSKFQFIHWANKRAVLLKVDFPYYTSLPECTGLQYKALKEKYKITCYPTVLGLRPDGSEIGRLEGYYPGTGVSDWLAGFEKITMPPYPAQGKSLTALSAGRDYAFRSRRPPLKTAGCFPALSRN